MRRVAITSDKFYGWLRELVLTFRPKGECCEGTFGTFKTDLPFVEEDGELVEFPGEGEEEGFSYYMFDYDKPISYVEYESCTGSKIFAAVSENESLVFEYQNLGPTTTQRLVDSLVTVFGFGSPEFIELIPLKEEMRIEATKFMRDYLQERLEPGKSDSRHLNALHPSWYVVPSNRDKIMNQFRWAKKLPGQYFLVQRLDGDPLCYIPDEGDLILCRGTTVAPTEEKDGKIWYAGYPKTTTFELAPGKRVIDQVGELFGQFPPDLEIACIPELKRTPGYDGTIYKNSTPAPFFYVESDDCAIEWGYAVYNPSGSSYVVVSQENFGAVRYTPAYPVIWWKRIDPDSPELWKKDPYARPWSGIH